MADKNTPLWNEELYELLEFIFWEPQHLGKTKNPNAEYKNWNDVLEHLERMEVILNHHFALFFNLISQKQKQSILSGLLGVNLDDCFEISSTNTRNFESTIDNFTQPDLLFEGLKSMVYVEMKVGGKSNCEQLLKYLLLHLLYEEKTGKSKNPYILFLGTHELKKFFQEKVETIEELKDCLRAYQLSEKLRRCKLDVALYFDRALVLLNQIHLNYINFKDFSKVIESHQLGTQNETEIKLLEGILKELEKRKLS